MEIDELTDNEFADWSARIMGWCRHRETEMRYAVWLGSCKNPLVAIENNQRGALYWNPRHSLEQCWIFEEWLIYKPDDRKTWINYLQDLVLVVSETEKHKSKTYPRCGWFPKGMDVHATSDQRCRALWLTMGGKE